MHALANTLGLLDQHLPSSLVGEAARRRLHRAASEIPAALSSCLYIECRPHDPDAADLIADVGIDGRAILAGANPVIRLSHSVRRHPAWTRIEDLARGWSTPGDSLHEGMSGAWLEFDAGCERDRMPVPSLFVDFSESTYRACSLAERSAPLLRAAYLLGHAISPDAGRLLDDAIVELPSGAALLYAGFMMGRDTDAIRLCITGLEREELITYLQALHWPGDASRLIELIESLATDDGGAQDRPAIVHLDVSGALGASIGLEYPFARSPQLRGQLTEAGLLDALVRRELLSPEQRDALSAWPALERRTMPHQLWPSFHARRVNHVKLVQDAGGMLTAKVYLCAEHTPSLRSRVGHSC